MNLDAIPYVPARWFSNGRRSNITMIVIHDMEAGEYSTTAESCANYFKNGSRQASAHYCCDNDSTVCSVLPENEAWHTGHTGTNRCSVGIEQAGYANQGIGFLTGWFDEYSLQMINEQVAPLTAALCDRYGIPVKFLTADDLRAGDWTGITSHREITYAFVQGGHTDPGPDYPWEHFLNEVNKNIGNPVEEMPRIDRTPAPTGDIYGIGSTGDKVREIQRLVGVAQDGIYGPITANAVRVWQQNLQIPADGIWGPRTQEATNQFFAWLASQDHPAASGEADAFLAALNDAMSQLLRNGSTGGAVKIAQGLLNAKGYPLVADGIFGPLTDGAVRRFQSNNGLQVDGVVGPQTWGALVA